MLWVVTASLAAAACFAVAGVLQQRAAARRPDDEALSFRLLLRLLRQPMWLAGIALAFLAYGFQALALARGPLSLVQPLIVSELLFAIPLAAYIRRTHLAGRDWLGTAAVTFGLASALSAARPGGDSPTASPQGWLLALGSVGGLTVGALLCSRALTGPARASCMALAGGLVMGLQSVLLAATVDQLGEDPLALLTAWQTYLLVAASISGLLLIQSAFQSGPLAATMPVIDSTEPAVAIVVGTVLFGEHVRLGWPMGAVAAVGAALALTGIVLLDTSPTMGPLTEEGRTRGTDRARPGGGSGDS
ncbi:DMT family transporter [Streptomyces smyrnaeus]|uniref:DMT family transporter n=1 Tax=Streptomyces smyrnaeus TaxID=1387713 RepID=A0ABS3XYA9_9ACTN|nr:DMT family transporter [Streptomyces smyrnaeus]MBO8200349.1 DMT family transporter [Streptomyces smyrnaeus]